MIPMTHLCDSSQDPSWKYRIHGYCEDVQEYCCREECDKGKQVMSSSRGLENECSGFKLHAPAKVFQSFVPPSKFLGGHSISREKEVQTGKTRYRPIEEILGLSLGTKWVKTTSSSRVVSTNHLNVSVYQHLLRFITCFDLSSSYLFFI
ncbi:hypothetical protein P3S68_006386 [Capsicum galapagoense]